MDIYLLIGVTHQYTLPMLLRPNVNDRLTLPYGPLILQDVNLKAQALACVEDSVSERSTSFSDASSKHEGVYLTSELGVVRTHISCRLVYENVEGQPTLGVARPVDLGEGSCSCYSSPARVLIEDLFCFGDVERLGLARPDFACFLGVVED